MTIKIPLTTIKTNKTTLKLPEDKVPQENPVDLTSEEFLRELKKNKLEDSPNVKLYKPPIAEKPPVEEGKIETLLTDQVNMGKNNFLKEGNLKPFYIDQLEIGKKKFEKPIAEKPPLKELYVDQVDIGKNIFLKPIAKKPPVGEDVV